MLSCSAFLTIVGYAQFSAGILILLGLFTRWAAAVMVFNFVVAVVGVHLGMPLHGPA